MWTLQGDEYVDPERLSIHQCNETDKSILSVNRDYIDTELYEKWWSSFYCLDNPEKLNMFSDINEKGIRSLFIDPYYCTEEDHCKPLKEIHEWKNKTEMSFAFYTNSRKFSPGEYGERIVLENLEYYEVLDVTDKVLTYQL